MVRGGNFNHKISTRFAWRRNHPNPEVKLVDVENSTSISICGNFQTVSSLTVMVSKENTRSRYDLDFFVVKVLIIFLTLNFSILVIIFLRYQ